MIKLTNQIKVRPGGLSDNLIVGRHNSNGRNAIYASGIETANVGGSMFNGFTSGGMSNSRSMSYINGAMAQYDTLLSGLVSEDEENLYRFYRDMYHYDSVAGSAIDLLSTLPFSEFTLVGMDKEKIAIYQSSIERLSFKTMLPELSVEYLTMGKFIGSLVVKASRKVFTDMMSHTPENATITPSPFMSVDPIIRVKQSEAIREFLSSDDRRLREIREQMNPSFMRALQAEEMVLDPATTLFLPRKTFATDIKGTSFLKRMMPVYLLEKTLYRGTLIEAGRRQRSLLHLEMGETGEWEPTPEELQAGVTLFQQADLDPLGAIVATRNGVTPNEVRQGGDFWKWTDIVDQLVPIKLRSLGISEAFLSGDMNLNAADVALSVFVENLRAYRDSVTQKIFYGKVFPIIAVMNEFFKKKGETASSDVTKQIRMRYMISDTSKLEMPQIHWAKALRPEADQAYLDVLRTLKEEGIPIPLSIWAAAGGVTLERILKSHEEETDTVEQLKKYGQQEGGDEGGGDPGMFASVMSGDPLKRVISRDYGNMNEVYGQTKTGKRRYVMNQNKMRNDIEIALASALTRLSDPHHYAATIKKAKATGQMKRIF